MKNIKFIIAITAVTLMFSCKKDKQYDEYLKLNYQTVSAAADTTVIDIKGNTTLIESNVTSPVATQDGGNVISVSGTVAGQAAQLKIVTVKGSKGIIYVNWLYNNGRKANIPFMKSDKHLIAGY